VQGTAEEKRVGAWSSFLETLRGWRGTPQERLAEVGLVRGMNVADVGARYGYFAFPAAEIVGQEGKVYAIEPNPGRARDISKTAEKRGTKNVVVLETGVEDLGEVPSLSVDLAMSMSSFHHFGNADRGLVELRRVVKPGGRIYIRDIKAGMFLRHGSRFEDFRRIVSNQFPQAKFENGSGYVLARVHL